MNGIQVSSGLYYSKNAMGAGSPNSSLYPNAFCIGVGTGTTPANYSDYDLATADTAIETGTVQITDGKIILDGWINTPQNNAILKGGRLNEVYLGDRTGSTAIQGDIALYPTTQVKYKNTDDVFLHTANLGSYVDGTTITYANNKLSATGAASMPSNKYIDLTLGASGSTYTAPANGYLNYVISPQSSNMYFELNGLLGTGSYGGGSITYGYHGFLPLKKGEVVTVNYINCSTSLFRFIYAEGSK